MKKLIAISVMIALVAGAAFAVDLSGNVITSATLMAGDTDGSDLTTGEHYNRIRLEGSGETDDGQFGGWLRFDGRHWSGSVFTEGYGFWKPIPEFKLIVGQFSDGYWGKTGYSDWMFYQTATDTSVADGGDNVWGGSIYGFGINMRSAFYNGFGDFGFSMEIKPADVFGINIAVPVGGNLDDDFLKLHAQVNFLIGDIGNASLVYRGNGKDEGGTIFAYFGAAGLGDICDLDFSVGVPVKKDEDIPINIGLGTKFSISDEFALKLRFMVHIADPFGVIADIMPYYAFNDGFRGYLSIGFGMLDEQIGLNVNPYIEIGQEWGMKFLAGVRFFCDDLDGGIFKFSVPIAFHLGF